MTDTVSVTTTCIRCVAVPAPELAELAAITNITSVIIDMPRHTSVTAAARRVCRLIDRIRQHKESGGHTQSVSEPLVEMLGAELIVIERLGAVTVAGVVERCYGGPAEVEYVLIVSIVPADTAPARIVGGGLEGGRRPVLVTERDRYLPISSRAVAGRAHTVFDLMPPRDPNEATGLVLH